MTKVTPDLMPKPTQEPTPRTKVMPDQMSNRAPKPTPKKLKLMPLLVHNYMLTTNMNTKAKLRQTPNVENHHRHEEDLRQRCASTFR